MKENNQLSPVRFRPPGRPKKFGPRVIKTILACVRRGLPLKLCAEAAGVSYASLASWRDTDKKFADALSRAIAKGADARLKRIEAASREGNWAASAWLLERTMPHYFGRNRLEVTGADGAPLAAAIALYLPEKQQQQPVTVESEPAGVSNADVKQVTSNGNGD